MDPEIDEKKNLNLHPVSNPWKIRLTHPNTNKSHYQTIPRTYEHFCDFSGQEEGVEATIFPPLKVPEKDFEDGIETFILQGSETNTGCCKLLVTVNELRELELIFLEFQIVRQKKFKIIALVLSRFKFLYALL